MQQSMGFPRRAVRNTGNEAVFEVTDIVPGSDETE